MTLRDLIEQLSNLPKSSKSLDVYIDDGCDYYEIQSIDDGNVLNTPVVAIKFNQTDDEDDD